MEDILKRLEEEAAAYRVVLSKLDMAITSLRDVIASRLQVVPMATHVQPAAIQQPVPAAKDVECDPHRSHEPAATTDAVPSPRSVRVGVSPNRPATAPDEDGILRGATMVEAASRILSSRFGAWMDHVQVTEDAIRLGYRSEKLGDDPEKIAESFRDTMRRHPEVFDRRGREFRLKRQQESDATGKVGLSKQYLERESIRILKESGRPSMKTADIAASLRDEGIGNDIDQKTFYNAVYTALSRSPDRVERVSAGEWAPKSQPDGEGQQNGSQGLDNLRRLIQRGGDE
jgi:hypothetical protein